MIRRLFILSSSLFLFVSVSAQRIKRLPSEKPKLIVGIVVDQMRYDYLTNYWDNFGEGGFKKMVNEGTLCSNANYNYMFNQLGVGETTIATGTTPSNHGIVSENWYHNLREEVINSLQDDKYTTVGSESELGKISPEKINVSTLGDELKLSNHFNSKVFGVSLDARSAVFLTGHTANGAYWYDQIHSKWITSSYYRDSLPGWVKEFNNKNLPDIYLERSWNLKLSLEKYHTCLPDKNDYELGIKKNNTFPYNYFDLSNLKRGKPDYSMLKNSPYGNTYTKDFAISLILNEELGKDAYTDLLMVGFNSPEYIGERFGPRSMEVQDIFLRFDEDLAHFLTFIDEHIGKENVMVFLTSNHGVSDIPDYLSDNKIPAGFFNGGSALSLLKSYLNVIYGKGNWIKHYENQQVFLNHTIIEDSKLSLAEVQTKSAQFLIQFSGVANTITSTTLEATTFTDGVFRKMQNSHNQQRSGDILINLKPGWIESSNRVTGSNSGYSYDTHVPLIWYGWKIGHIKITSPVNMSDIAPTISSLLEIAFPNSCTGKPIMELAK